MQDYLIKLRTISNSKSSL